MTAAAVASLSSSYPEARQLADPKNRHLQICRLIAQIPTIAALPIVEPWDYP